MIKVLARTIKLVRAQVPHLSEIPGFKSLKFVQQMYTDITNKLPVVVELIKLVNAGGSKLMNELGDAGDDLKDGVVDLLVVRFFLFYASGCRSHTLDHSERLRGRSIFSS